MLKISLIFIVCIMSIANGFAEEKAASAQHSQIEFVEKEPGHDPVKIRMLLSEEFLRIDSGEDVGDYILYNRQDKVIMNVVHDDKTILTIKYATLDLPPLTENIQVDKTQAPLPDAPKINGSELKQIVTTVNNQDCKKTVVAVDLMPKITAAMQDLNLVLAEQYAKGLNPALLNSDMAICDMVVSTYEVNGDLIYGFPVQSSRANGWSRSLVDFTQDITVKPELFAVPEDYQAYWLQ